MENHATKIPLFPQAKLDAITYKFLDVAYCDQSPAQILDIYLPEKGEGPFPVILHVHGGAFLFGTQRDDNIEPVLRGLARGYAIVSIQYRMSGEAKFPALIFDAKAAVRFVRANAKKYSFDAQRIAAWGPSAGGYIVSMLGLTASNPAFEDLSMGNADQSSHVDAVVDWCGPCGNFLDMDASIIENGIGEPDHNDPMSPESLLFGSPIQSISQLVAMASPCKYVHKNCPPFLIQHGEADPIVPVQQSIRLATEIERKAGKDKVVLECYADKGHHGQPWYNEEWLSDKVFAFLDNVFKINRESL